MRLVAEAIGRVLLKGVRRRCTSWKLRHAVSQGVVGLGRKERLAGCQIRQVEFVNEALRRSSSSTIACRASFDMAHVFDAFDAAIEVWAAVVGRRHAAVGRNGIVRDVGRREALTGAREIDREPVRGKPAPRQCRTASRRANAAARASRCSSRPPSHYRECCQRRDRRAAKPGRPAAPRRSPVPRAVRSRADRRRLETRRRRVRDSCGPTVACRIRSRPGGQRTAQTARGPNVRCPPASFAGNRCRSRFASTGAESRPRPLARLHARRRRARGD